MGSVGGATGGEGDATTLGGGRGATLGGGRSGRGGGRSGMHAPDDTAEMAELPRRQLVWRLTLVDAAPPGRASEHSSACVED